MLRAWAYPQLAKVATDYSPSTTVSSGTVDVFVARAGQPIGPQHLDVTATQVTRGSSADAGGNSAYYETSVRLDSAALGGEAINTSVEGVCFERFTGEVTQECRKQNYGSYDAGVVQQVPFAGQFFKFPFSTQKRSYPFWDGVVGKAVPAEYKGTDSIDGLTVYRFVQEIPDQVVGQPRQLPGDVFGMGTGTVDADVHYAVTRTMWVEPQTGAVIKGQSDQKRRFVVGALERPYLVGLIGYTPETVAANVQAQRSNAQKLHLLNDLALPVGVIAGLLLTLLGLMLVLRRTPDAAAAPSAPPARHLDAWASDV